MFYTGFALLSNMSWSLHSTGVPMVFVKGWDSFAHEHYKELLNVHLHLVTAFRPKKMKTFFFSGQAHNTNQTNTCTVTGIIWTFSWHRCKPADCPQQLCCLWYKRKMLKRPRVLNASVLFIDCQCMLTSCTLLFLLYRRQSPKCARGTQGLSYRCVPPIGCCCRRW